MSEPTNEPAASPTSAAPAAGAARPLRLRSAVRIVVGAAVLIVLARMLLAGNPSMAVMPLFVGFPLAAVALVFWWLFGSGLRWKTRLLGLTALIGTTAIVMSAAHRSMRALITMFALPIPMMLCVLWLEATGKRIPAVRRAGPLALAVATVVLCLTLRHTGMSGAMVPELVLRWSWGSDERAVRYLRTAEPSAVPPETHLAVSACDWPEFRGPQRDGVVRGSAIRHNWNEQPPELLWRHPVGLGWSSFAVVGNLAFTQEQRQDEEVVVCYEVHSGKQVWVHADTTRFSEAMGGDGPRATPTFHDGNIYALGAGGILNCLDARTGRLIWSTNILDDNGATNLTWGMAGSPLVFDELVVVNPGGAGGHGLVAYDRHTGRPVWHAGDHRAAYSSPQLAVLGGTRQVLIYDAFGLAGYDAGSGEQLWKFRWSSNVANNCIQPHVLDDSSVLIGTATIGTTRRRVTPGTPKWSVTEDWTTTRLKLKFNDIVIRDGFGYGLDEGILTCIDLADGGRRWKRGRYGYGQVVLVGDVLLIQAESGAVALVRATPAAPDELGRFQAIEGKTWNHPAVATGRLFVRNGVEAACYDMGIWSAKRTEVTAGR